MPTTEVHRKLTRFALELVPELFRGSKTVFLTERYCCFPDLTIAGDAEAQRFLFERNGIPFHYLPDSPLENLYRHYRMGTDGKLKRSRSFVNPHYEFALEGLTHYLTLIPNLLRMACFDDAMKATGVLLHVLQDNSFGVHTLEGPGGTDVFFFDRLKLWNTSPFETLCRITCGNVCPVLPRSPFSLGDSPEEAALRIYRHWCDAIRTGRATCVKLLLENHTDLSTMTANTILLCADVLQTILELSRGRTTGEAILSLNEFEPYESPSRTMEENPDRSLVFSIVTEEHLLYRFPENIFSSLSAELLLPDGKSCQFELENDGIIVQKGKAESGLPIKLDLDSPRNKAGFRFYADRGPVRIALKSPSVHRAARQTCLPPLR